MARALRLRTTPHSNDQELRPLQREHSPLAMPQHVQVAFTNVASLAVQEKINPLENRL
jgi:hypothetical protein